MSLPSVIFHLLCFFSFPATSFLNALHEAYSPIFTFTTGTTTLTPTSAITNVDQHRRLLFYHIHHTPHLQHLEPGNLSADVVHDIPQPLRSRPNQTPGRSCECRPRFVDDSTRLASSPRFSPLRSPVKHQHSHEFDFDSGALKS